jgi:hypothetical protein
MMKQVNDAGVVYKLYNMMYNGGLRHEMRLLIISICNDNAHRVSDAMEERK